MSDPPLQSKGIEAYKRTWDLFFSWTRDPVVFDFTEMNITAGSDVAFVAALMRCAGTSDLGSLKTENRKTENSKSDEKKSQIRNPEIS